jgi:hypothetical protein
MTARLAALVALVALLGASGAFVVARTGGGERDRQPGRGHSRTGAAPGPAHRVPVAPRKKAARATPTASGRAAPKESKRTPPSKPREGVDATGRDGLVPFRPDPVVPHNNVNAVGQPLGGD